MAREVDNRPTMAEWPVKIWSEEEIPQQWQQEVKEWMREPFANYHFVCAPKRKASEQSFAYLFGYGNDDILYIKEGEEGIFLKKSQIVKAEVRKELLQVVLSVFYIEEGEPFVLRFPYVASTYYLYDPFLNWILGKNRDFMPEVVEAIHPRPTELYEKSLVMYNYSLGAYRLGEKFGTYEYYAKNHRHRFFPWKKTLEEWLDVKMEYGTYKLHSFKYLTEFIYQLDKCPENLDFKE